MEGITSSMPHLWGMLRLFSPELGLFVLSRSHRPVDGFWRSFPQEDGAFLELGYVFLYFGTAQYHPPYMGVSVFPGGDHFVKKDDYCPQSREVFHSFE
jgi:hypothetical protein